MNSDEYVYWIVKSLATRTYIHGEAAWQIRDIIDEFHIS
jgi:hypothetical protein